MTTVLAGFFLRFGENLLQLLQQIEVFVYNQSLFVTKKEADEYYKKAAKRPSKTKVLKPQKSEAAVYMASRKEIERKIHEYADKRGVLKSGFDVEIVRTS